jgi:hypothetical protein
VEKEGLVVRDLKHLVTCETGAATAEATRAVVELVHDDEAVLEQGHERYPDDGILSSGQLSDDGQVWLVEYAPSDERQARKRILELVQGAEGEGIAFRTIKMHLHAEGIEAVTVLRAIEKLVESGEIHIQEPTHEGLLIEPRLITDEHILRLSLFYKPQPSSPDWQPFHVRIQPYRLPISTDLLMDEFRMRVTDKGRIKNVTFTARPSDSDADPLFGTGANAMRLASVQAEHKLMWQFQQPVNKEALLNLVTHLLNGLQEKGEMIIEAAVDGEVSSNGA